VFNDGSKHAVCSLVLFLSVTTSAAGCKFALLTPFLVNTDGRQDAAGLL